MFAENQLAFDLWPQNFATSYMP